jgi:hypothetical protein
MIIDPLVCQRCGAKLTIETDDRKYADKRREEFFRQHEDCPSFPRPVVSAEAGRVS